MTVNCLSKSIASALLLAALPAFAQAQKPAATAQSMPETAAAAASGEQQAPIPGTRMRTMRARWGTFFGPLAPDYCVLAVALPGYGSETNWVACMIPTPSGVGTETR